MMKRFVLLMVMVSQTIDIQALLEFHNLTNAKATLQSHSAPGRFGALALDGDKIIHLKRNQKVMER
jgi:hypothetical protein